MNELTKSEQLKYQVYVIKRLTENQSLIIKLLEENNTEDSHAFMDYMIKYNYEQAFKLCTSRFCIHGELPFMKELLNCFYPSVVQDWSKYFILVQTDTSDDFRIFDKCLTNECKAFDLIYQKIYN